MAYTEAHRRANAKYRAANTDACRERSRNCNNKRYATDERYRVSCAESAKNRNRKQVEQKSTIEINNACSNKKSTAHTLEYYFTTTTQTSTQKTSQEEGSPQTKRKAL